MWLKMAVKLLLVLNMLNMLVLSAVQSAEIPSHKLSWRDVEVTENKDEIEIGLPSAWENEDVRRMVREVLMRDLVQDQVQNVKKRQYKRDIYSTSSASSSPSIGTQPTRKMSTTITTQKLKKPTKSVQIMSSTTINNKNKNRIQPSITTKATTKPTLKPTLKPTITLNSNVGNTNTNSSKVKPTKYHYYPHNQHPYFLPECAIQQVCNAVYVRLNFTQPLCVCPPRYRDPCSASLNEDDNHTITLVGNANRKAVTLAKTCEQTTELRDCRAPRDWSILALQNTRTGKSHYLVICKCPNNFRLEGPLPHDQPTYAGLPGINVYGMLCVPSSTTASQMNKWKQQRPAITSSYRTKNTTIEATNSIDNTESL
ncbi:unnamed protein product [Diamesa hyperborea]